ncbi:MAG: bifunctional hydroxymethylpyrimidine kinase/phosphomethylpyrimidine kinase [Kiritimatiellia bacterium]
MRQLDPSTLETVRNKLLPRASVFAPNLPEAEWFSGLTGLSLATMPDAARRLLELGAASMLVKGGHLPGDFCQDFWSDGEHSFWLTSPRLPDTITTGAGGILSAAITAALAGSPPSATRWCSPRPTSTRPCACARSSARAPDSPATPASRPRPKTSR